MPSTWPVAAALVVAVAFTCIARLYNIMIYGHMAIAGYTHQFCFETFFFTE